VKVYTDYGNSSVKALESCVIVIEDVSEWSLMAQLLEKEAERLQETIEKYPDAEELVKMCQEDLDFIKRIIPQLNHRNSLPLKQLDLNKLPLGLWRKK